MNPQRGGLMLHIFLKLFTHSFTFILIIVPLYRRKFCDGLIILVIYELLTLNSPFESDAGQRISVELVLCSISATKRSCRACKRGSESTAMG